MKEIRYTESQFLKEVEVDRATKDVCREFGISQGAYYNQRVKPRGMEVSDVKRLKELEQENQRLKKMYGSLCLEYHAL